jgi:alpha-tubulin suppressor-like RCC1 family protein
VARTSADRVSSRVVWVVALLAVAVLGFSITVGASGAPSAPTVIQISASGDHTCAVMSGGTVKCWGSNWYGQLGNGKPPMNCGTTRKCPKQSSGTPVDVVGLGSGVKAVAAGGYHSCALTSRGGVKCWGYNATGQLGNGGRTCPSLDVCPRARSSTPVDVIGLASGVSAIAAGGFFTCALMTKGAVKCWGANLNGQLGNASSQASSRPVDVIGLASGVSTIVAGGRYSCAVTSAGGVKCWGSSLRSIAGLASGVTSVAVGAGASDAASVHICALTAEGGVKCWGSNGAGQLGNASQTDSQTPVDVVGLSSGVRAIAAGSTYTCALTSGGGVKCWGSNYFGELGNGSQTASRIPVDVAGLKTGVEAITAGTLSACALTSRGEAKCWGSNYRGTLGTGTAIKLSRKPVDVRFSGKPSAKPSTPAPGSSEGPLHSYRLRWPSRAGQTATYDLRFKSPRLRALSLRVYGKAVPRGFGFDFIVACEHRSPAILNWDWTQSGGYVRIKVRMTTGRCSPPGPTVAGMKAALTFRSVT